MKTLVSMSAAFALVATAALAQSTEEFVNKVAVSDMFEVQSSEFLLSKGPDKDSGPFARKMVKDHTKTSKELKQLIERGKVRATLPAALDSEHQKKLDQLKSLSGRELDVAYDKAQVEGHEQAVSLFEAYTKSGDNPDLKKWAGKTLPHLRSHLAMARKLK